MSDESDRRRTYAELAGRGQPVPGKFFGVIPPKGKAVPSTKGPAKMKAPFKPKQLNLFKKKDGGVAERQRKMNEIRKQAIEAYKDPNKRLSKNLRMHIERFKSRNKANVTNMKAGGYTVKNRYSDIMLPEKKRTTRIT